ncbi:MAG: MBL fold metallo-hydrolase [Deltaproteobacteria bacterium]|uniref:MBL fold metallo-hydrolase n=1 Tax=Candidatus Desulfacyla euxinica TaxID=2841693 RepID=A0A8J6MYY5_9DELT|nr:MBL fold metallo-hydrolase [Candidatus Desulfacyla euxinica]
MIEELLPDLFRIEIPLPDSPLKYLNSYVIRSPERNLVIDTGLNRKECLEAMEAGLEEIKIDLGKTDFFITHLHADHFGLVGKIVTDTSKVFFNRPDSELIESWDGWEPMVEYAGRNGFPKSELRNALKSHPGFKFHSQWVPKLSILTDDDTIRTGDYHFRCIETPGHTEGHTCLYEAEKKIFICGDHILIDITPNIQCWSERENPLKNYLTSLEKVRELDVELVLPGHRRVFKNHGERIDELKEHHYRRIEEVLTILNNEPKNAYQVASEMTWDIACDSWEQFPLAQKWFATGEAIAHLRYLEEDRSIFRKKGEEEILFSREPA